MPNALAPNNLPYQMRLLVQLLTRQFHEVIAPFDLTPLHWGILSCLWQQDGLMTRAIASQLEQLGGTLTVGLDSMERRRLIRRAADADDRRISRVWLTKRGIGLRAEVLPVVQNFVDRSFSCLTEEEAIQLAATVQRLKIHLEKQSHPEQIRSRPRHVPITL